jgi:hypothetical protein
VDEIKSDTKLKVQKDAFVFGEGGGGNKKQGAEEEGKRRSGEKTIWRMKTKPSVTMMEYEETGRKCRATV